LDTPNGTPVRVDITFGVSVLNFDDTELAFTGADIASPLTRHHRKGGAARVAFGRMSPGSPSTSGWVRMLREGMTPLAAVTVAGDHADIAAGAGPTQYETNGEGVEVSLANMLALRWGHYEDLVGQIHDSTWGVGAALPLGRGAGIRYDWASWPQAHGSGLENRNHHQLSIWLNPFAGAH
jgi:hypothetical protein